MLNKIASAALSCLLLVCAPLAQAGMLTFDDLEFDGTSSAGLLSAESYDGFEWDSLWSVGSTERRGFSSAATSGSQFIFNGKAERNLTVRRDTDFDFLGVTFAHDTSFPSYFFYVTAYDGEGSQVGQFSNFFRTSGPHDVSVKFFGVRKLVFNNQGGTYALDNFSYRIAAVNVTEAGSLALLVIGIIGLWAARRRGQLQA